MKKSIFKYLKRFLEDLYYLKEKNNIEEGDIIIYNDYKCFEVWGSKHIITGKEKQYLIHIVHVK